MEIIDCCLCISPLICSEFSFHESVLSKHLRGVNVEINPLNVTLPWSTTISFLLFRSNSWNNSPMDTSTTTEQHIADNEMYFSANIKQSHHKYIGPLSGNLPFINTICQVGHKGNLLIDNWTHFHCSITPWSHYLKLNPWWCKWHEPNFYQYLVLK